ncbi:hypothetical protein CSB37_01930 [bacterium DOLZORAL124_38_8]|nr:MAG: hypothetical protein CSB37_01930 [bacterium DOLZORAL124_38_8]
MFRENETPNFTELYREYSVIYDNIENTLISRIENYNIDDLESLRTEFNYFDVKLRLSFAINDIVLNTEFSPEKSGDLKLCHLMLYKFNDLWFAYEAFKKLYNKINTKKIQSLTIWLSQNTNREYSEIRQIQTAVERANTKLREKFNNEENLSKLKRYIRYCERESKNGQKTRLNKILEKFNGRNNLEQLNITDLLTLSYSIRNNFVHNGETTITTPELDYSKKKDLIVVLYELLSIICLSSIKKMING